MRTAASAPYAARGIVLRTRPLGEKDRIVEMFGPGIGRWSAVARGARGGKSKLSALSQPFVCARLLLARGRSLDVLTQGEIENAHFHIPSNLLAAAWASYWCEVVASLPERHAEDEVFELLEAALGTLDLLCAHAEPNPNPAPNQAAQTTQAASNEPADEPLAEPLDEPEPLPARMMLLGHWFEARFLAALGFGSVVGSCARCEAKIVVSREHAEARVAFSPAMGGTLCASCAPSDPERLSPRAHTLRLLHRLQRTELPSLLPPASTSARLEAELRTLLRRSLLAHLDIRPRSRRFLDDLAAHPS